MCNLGAEFLKKMREREKEMGLKLDPAVDAYLKATAVSGKRQNAVTQFIMRVLGLEVRTAAFLSLAPILRASCLAAVGVGYMPIPCLARPAPSSKGVQAWGGLADNESACRSAQTL